MVKVIADKAEVLALLDIIDVGEAPLDSRLKAIKRLEYILGRDILNTKDFKRIKDEFSKPVAENPETTIPDTKFGAETSVERKTKRGRYSPTHKQGKHE
jgi:hypothetical protein